MAPSRSPLFLSIEATIVVFLGCFGSLPLGLDQRAGPTEEHYRNCQAQERFCVVLNHRAHCIFEDYGMFRRFFISSIRPSRSTSPGFEAAFGYLLKNSMIALLMLSRSATARPSVSNFSIAFKNSADLSRSELIV